LPKWVKYSETFYFTHLGRNGEKILFYPIPKTFPFGEKLGNILFYPTKKSWK